MISSGGGARETSLNIVTTQYQDTRKLNQHLPALEKTVICLKANVTHIYNNDPAVSSGSLQPTHKTLITM